MTEQDPPSTKILWFPRVANRDELDRWLIILRPHEDDYRVVEQRPASGPVIVASDARVQLGFHPGTRADFSALSTLAPDDLYLVTAERTQFMSEDLRHVGRLTGLRRIDLGSTPLLDEGLIYLRTLTSLESLDLSGTEVGDEGLVHLRDMRELRLLNLGITSITDDGLELLATLGSLEELSLYATQVSDAGLEYLRGFQRLRLLHVEDTHVTEKGADRLRHLLPDCSVHLTWADNGEPEGAFDYQERARAAEEARLLLDRAYEEKRRTHSLPGSPGEFNWFDAGRAFEEALERAYPAGFWEKLDLLQKGDLRGLEEAVRFLEADPWFFRSGYIKADLIRYIMRLPLSTEYMRRLQDVVLAAIRNRDRREFRRFCRLARRVGDASFRERVQTLTHDADEGIRRRARWVLDALQGSAPRRTVWLMPQDHTSNDGGDVLPPPSQ